MKRFAPVFAALAAVLAVSFAAPVEAAPKRSADGKKIYRSQGPLKGVIYGNRRRPGGYSYKYSDVIQPGRFAHHPEATGLHDSGVIDGDFFYPRARGPFGGYTPYMH